MRSTVPQLGRRVEPLSVRPCRIAIMDPQLKASDDREEDRVQFSYFTRFEEYQKHSTRFLEVVEDPEHNDEAFDLFRRIGMIVRCSRASDYIVSSLFMPGYGLSRAVIPP